MLHTITFTAHVNQTFVNALISNCLSAINQGATELNSYISSQGGDLVAGFTAYHFLKALPIPVKTHNLSNVESVANIIFLAGSERKANPGSRFLLHPFHWGLAGPSVDHSRISEWGACLDNDLEHALAAELLERADLVGHIVRLTGLEHADPKDLIASMRGHEAEVMRLLREIEALVNEVQA